MGQHHSKQFPFKSTYRSKKLQKESNIQYGVCQYQGKREFMEDTSISVPHFQGKNIYLFGVFDGHGGPEVAQFVQNHFADQLKVSPEFQDQNYGGALISVNYRLDSLLQSRKGRVELYSIIDQNIEAGNRLERLNNMSSGCTSNVCLITPSQICVANAGDSRCVGCCNGKAVALSFDHKPTLRAEYKRILRAGGKMNNKGRIFCQRSSINVSRSIGDLDFKQNKSLSENEQSVICTPEVISCKRQMMSFILLGCDGVWQKYSNEVIVSWIADRLKQKIEPHDILQELFENLLQQDESGYSCHDNLSGILVVFKK